MTQPSKLKLKDNRTMFLEAEMDMNETDIIQSEIDFFFTNENLQNVTASQKAQNHGFPKGTKPRNFEYATLKFFFWVDDINDEIFMWRFRQEILSIIKIFSILC